MRAGEGDGEGIGVAADVAEDKAYGGEYVTSGDAFDIGGEEAAFEKVLSGELLVAVEFDGVAMFEEGGAAGVGGGECDLWALDGEG